MSLFEFSSQEKEEMRSWLEEIHVELKNIAISKSQEYDYNFLDEVQLSELESIAPTKSERISLDYNNYDDDRISTRPSRNTFLDTPEFLDDLPNLATKQ